MNIVFIVGYWNSGTTLLTDILRKHPELKLKQARYKPNLEERKIRKILKQLNTDFFDFGDYSEVIANGFVNYQQPKFNEEERKKFRRAFDWAFGVSKRKHLLLKNPYLFFFNDFIEENFATDKVKKIVILRNGRAQAVSKDYWLRDKENPEKRLISRAIFWRKAMERYFETWYHDPNCLTIRYENLCKRPNAIIQQVCSFLDLPFSPIKDNLPVAFENRMTNWEKLEKHLKQQVVEQVQEIQDKIDAQFPVK